MCSWLSPAACTDCAPAPPPTAVTASEFQLIRPLGEGSFGQVFLARYCETMVAVSTTRCGPRPPRGAHAPPRLRVPPTACILPGPAQRTCALTPAWGLLAARRLPRR